MEAVPPDPLPSGQRRVASGQSPDSGAHTPSGPAMGGYRAYRTVPEILAGANLADSEERARVVAEMTAAEDARCAAVLAKAAQLGIPIRKKVSGHRTAVLHDFRGDVPLYRVTVNANAAISSGANLIRAAPYNLSGSGIKVGIWDEGSVLYTHQELTGRVTRKNTSAAYSDHATHVAGTIGATGVVASAKGMAPSVTMDSYDWNSDYAEMTAAGAATASDTTRIPISNHSYGYEVSTNYYLMGQYETEARAVDALAASLPYYEPFWAAGNEQDVLTNKFGYESITFDGVAKNVLTVGAVADAVTSGARDPSKAAILYFSSLGPCDDGRIKPDVVANGEALYSSISTGTAAYASYSGTSMATPSAVGSAALLEQLYVQNFPGTYMRASMLKALLIHTADDRGNAGPDYTYGWGLINVKAAAGVILAHKASITSPKMIEGSITTTATSNTYTFTWDGTSPIRATLCWTDPAGVAQTSEDSRTPNLVNNLDLRIIAPDGTTVYQPYIMPYVGRWTQAAMSLPATTGDNNVDNVEQVHVTAPAQGGVYTVTVTLDGSLTNSAQAYSLILTGGAETNPPPTVSITSPASGSTATTDQAVNITASASDTILGGAAGVVASVEFFVNGSSIGVDATSPYEAQWTPSTSGVHALTAQATDTEGASATSSTVTVTVRNGILFSENMGSPSATTSIANNVFQNSQLTFGGTADVRSTTPSSGYSGASGGGNVFITTTVGTYFEISGINTLGYANLALTLGHYKSTKSGSNELAIEVSPDGLNYTALSYSRPTGPGTTTWIQIAPSGVIPSTGNLHIRFRQPSTTLTQFRVDDVVLTGTLAAVTPAITVGSPPGPTPATYGSPSPAPASFVVSGANMTEGILVTPPAGFEVSQSAGGADGYADTQTIGAAGTIAETTLHLRLKAGLPLGSYSGDVACTSAGAVTAYLATTTSDVSRAALSITASPQSKAFGTALTLGEGQTAFTSMGLAPGETIGSVTLTASGGLAAYDAVGTYDLTPSAATGGSFDPANYDLSYANGTLTVTGKSFGDWTAEKPGLNGATGPNDDPEPDGLPNLVEYFMGLDPTVANPGALVPACNAGEYSIRYRRNKNQQGVTGGMVWKSDLLDPADWSNAGVVDTVLEDHGDYEIREARITVDPAGAIRFMRLRVIAD